MQINVCSSQINVSMPFGGWVRIPKRHLVILIIKSYLPSVPSAWFFPKLLKQSLYINQEKNTLMPLWFLHNVSLNSCKFWNKIFWKISFQDYFSQCKTAKTAKKFSLSFSCLLYWLIYALQNDLFIFRIRKEFTHQSDFEILKIRL